jgi:predicted nucleic acid-binding protein
VAIRADRAIIDDREGRRAAGKLGLTVIGTLSVLERAAESALLDGPAALQAIRSVGFRVSPEVAANLFRR